MADRAPVDNTCSAECSNGGWSGCAGSEAAMALLQSHRRCGPLSTGNHTTDSYSWSPLLQNRCCLGLLGENRETSVKYNNMDVVNHIKVNKLTLSEL